MATKLLLEFLQTNARTKLIEDLRELIQSKGRTKTTESIQQILHEVNDWNLEDVQSIVNQLISDTDDDGFKTILNLFNKHLILLLYDQIIEKTDDLNLKIKTFLNKAPILNEAYELSLKLKDDAIINKSIDDNIDVNTTLGLFSLHSGNLESAIEFFNKSLTFCQANTTLSTSKHSFILRIISSLLLKASNDPKLMKLAIATLKGDFGTVDPFQLALTLLNQAISIDERVNNLQSLALDYYNLALLHYEKRDFKQAIQEIKKANGLHEDLGDSEGLLNDIIFLGTIVSESNQKNTALEIFSQALAIAIETESRYQIAQINLLKGNILRENKDFEESMKHLKTALAIFKQEKAGSDHDLIDSTSSISSLLWDIGRLDSAVGYLSKLIEVEKKSGNPPVLMELYAQLAMTHLHSGDDASFNKYYNEVISLYQSIRDPLHYARIEYQIGAAFANLLSYQEALNHLGKSLKIFYEHKVQEQTENVLNALSLVYTKLIKPEIAREIIDSAKNVFERAQYILEQGGIADVKLPDISTALPTRPPLLRPETPVATPKIQLKQQATTTAKATPEPSPPSATVISPSAVQKPPMATIVEDKSSLKLPTPPVKEPPSAPKAPIATPIREEVTLKPPIPTATMEPAPKSPPVTTPPTPPKIRPITKLEQAPAEAEEKTPTFVGIQCPNCSFLVTNPQFTFCPQCASKFPVSRQCGKCGFMIENPDFKFCPKCATPLE